MKSFAASALFLLASTSLGFSAEKKWFIDSNTVFQKGSELSNEYLKRNAPDFAKTVSPSVLPWIVRIEVQHSFTETSCLSNHGTGTILPDGRVVTAKHVIDLNVKNTDDIKIKLTTNDGRVFPAQLTLMGETDWAMLQIEVSEASADLMKSPIKIAPPIAGETAIFMGYPARLGLDAAGTVSSFHPGDATTATSRLFPMPVVGKVDTNENFSVSPLAGFPPVGGMSGGPIFNLKGDLIAVQKAIATTTNDITGEAVDYNIKGESSDLLELSAAHSPTTENTRHLSKK